MWIRATLAGGSLMWTTLLAKRELESTCNLKPQMGEMIEQVIRLGFPALNNEPEYEVILAEVDLVKSVSSENLIIHSDSQLIVGHVNGEYET